MPFDWQGLATLLNEQAGELREKQDPETAGLSGLLADAQRAFLEGYGGGGYLGGGSAGRGAPAGVGGVNMPSPRPQLPGGFDSPGRDQFTDPHEAAFGAGIPSHTTGRQEMGYWDNGLNNRVSRQLLGMARMNPYGVVSKGMEYLTDWHNNRQDRENFSNWLEDNPGLANSPLNNETAFGMLYEQDADRANNQAAWENFLSDNLYWGTRDDIGIGLQVGPGEEEDTVRMQGRPSGMFNTGRAPGLLGGLRPMGGWFQPGYSLHSGPGGMTAGSLLRSVRDARWGSGGVSDFFQDDPYYGGL